MARRLAIVACGDLAARTQVACALANAARWLEVREATSERAAHSLLVERSSELAALVCDESVNDAWVLAGEAELRCPDAYRAMICADISSARALELCLHGGEPWPRQPLGTGRIVARVLASACSLPAVAIAACGLADELGLSMRQARIMSAHVMRRSRKQVAADLGVSEASCSRDVAPILSRMAMSAMDDVATEVLRRAVARPLIPRGGG